MKVLNYGKQYIDNKDYQSVRSSLSNEYLTTGPFVKRFENIIDIPYSFVIIAFTHKTNFTNLRKSKSNALIDKSTGKDITFYDTFDIELQLFIDSIVKNLNR